MHTADIISSPSAASLARNTGAHAAAPFALSSATDARPHFDRIAARPTDHSTPARAATIALTRSPNAESSLNSCAGASTTEAATRSSSAFAFAGA